MIDLYHHLHSLYRVSRGALYLNDNKEGKLFGDCAQFQCVEGETSDKIVLMFAGAVSKEYVKKHANSGPQLLRTTIHIEIKLENGKIVEEDKNIYYFLDWADDSETDGYLRFIETIGGRERTLVISKPQDVTIELIDNVIFKVKDNEKSTTAEITFNPSLIENNKSNLYVTTPIFKDADGRYILKDENRSINEIPITLFGSAQPVQIIGYSLPDLRIAIEKQLKELRYQQEEVKDKKRNEVDKKLLDLAAWDEIFDLEGKNSIKDSDWEQFAKGVKDAITQQSEI